MCFSNDNITWDAWEPCATSKPWILPGGNGNKTVYCQFKDEAGNLSGVGSSSIILKTGTPAGTVAINGGSPYTRTTNVLLSISAGANLQMRLSNNSDFSGASWENVLAVKSWPLGAGDGSKRVFAQFKDEAANLSPAVSAQIVLDATAPRDGALNRHFRGRRRGSQLVRFYRCDQRPEDLSPLITAPMTFPPPPAPLSTRELTWALTISVWI